MSARPQRSLKSKLLRITATIMLLLSTVTLTSAAWVNYATEKDRLADIERHIRQSVWSKGATLTQSHAIALKSLVADNAFSDVRNLVSRAVEQDDDVVYGVFVSAENAAWAYASPTYRTAGDEHAPPPSDAWKELGLDLGRLVAQDWTERRVVIFDKEIQEFAATVFGDDHERLGTIVYGLSNDRMRLAVEDAQARSKQVLVKALATIGILVLAAFALGTMLVSRAAARITSPIVKLTSAANKIAKGKRGVRVDIESGDEVEVLAAAFNLMLQANEEAMRTLEVTTERALESDRLKGEFLANMSHEIRTPMNGVLGMVKLMRGLPLDGKLAKYVETIDSSANSLLTIINDILDFSKLDAGKYIIEAVLFQPRAVVQEALELLASRAHDKRIDLVYRTDLDLPDFAVGDPDRLKQVLSNLVGNAIKFTNQGEIFVDVAGGARFDDGSFMLRIAVHDTGIGIGPADLPRLYDVFSQLDGSMARRQGGTGLGLAICKRLVAMMGGEIQAESQPGVGSVFTFTVKLGPASDRERAPARPMQVSAFAGKRLLLAEPSQRWREVIAQHVEEWGLECAFVDGAARVPERLAEAAKSGERFDFVVLDAGWGDAPISDVVARVRASRSWATTPLVLLTTHRVDASLSDLLQRKAVKQVTKPLRSSELYDCLLGTLPGPLPRPVADGEKPILAVGTGKKILVVDDNDVNKFVAAEELELRGYSVDVASNGLEAIAKVKEGGFTAVLMDCQMPVMDGYAATQEIRKWEAETGTGRIPIIALTAHAFAGERERVLRAGMDDYLSKPFRSASLGKLLGIYATDDSVGEGQGDDREISRGVARSEKLIRLFQEDVPRQLALLAAAIEKGEADRVFAGAHKLKGSCLAVAAGPMSKVAELLRKRAEQGDMVGAKAALAEIRARFGRVEILLEEDLALSLALEASQGAARESTPPS